MFANKLQKSSKILQKVQPRRANSTRTGTVKVSLRLGSSKLYAIGSLRGTQAGSQWRRCQWSRCQCHGDQWLSSDLARSQGPLVSPLLRRHGVAAAVTVTQWHCGTVTATVAKARACKCSGWPVPSSSESRVHSSLRCFKFSDSESLAVKTGSLVDVPACATSI